MSRVCIVTGANRGLGFEIARQLAENGVMVVLTARDEKKGTEAVEKLKGFGLAHLVAFHQLDVTKQSSVDSLVEFITTKFGKLDILVNNAGTIAVTGDELAMKDYIMGNATVVESHPDTNGKFKVDEKVAETYELAEQCVQTYYFGSKRMIEAFVPLLHLSDSPRIVNMSSVWGLLKCVENEWAISVLSDFENLTEEKVEEVMKEFLKDFKEGSLEAKKWTSFFPANAVAKACLNAYTRVIAKQYPKIYINSADPGHTQTDMSSYTGPLTVEQGASTPVKVALLPHGGPSGVFIVYEKVPSSLDNYPIVTISSLV